jgi:hypothetical protein
MLIFLDGKVFNTLRPEQWIGYLKTQSHAPHDVPYSHCPAMCFQVMLQSERRAIKERQAFQKKRKQRAKEQQRLKSQIDVLKRSRSRYAQA